MLIEYQPLNEFTRAMRKIGISSSESTSLISNIII